MSLDSQVDGAVVHDRVDGHDAVARRWVSSTRVAELEATIAQLREAMVSRQQLGVVTGIVAAKLEVTPDEAWAVLVRLSQDTNVKVREVGRVILDAYTGRLATDDQRLAALLDAKSPDGSGLLLRFDHHQR
ncbi:MAG TPA: ANTAR domain-containing protein [Lapillicoccus sp.]